MKWLRAHRLLVVFIGALLGGGLFALAQTAPGPNAGVISRGNFLRIPDYETTSPLALYVDLRGNDNNSCTGTDTSACLTLQGACAKVPKLIRHPVTIDIDAGSYPGAWCMGYNFDPIGPDAGAYLYVRGAQPQVIATADGGTAGGGMASSGTAGSTFTFGTLTELSDGGTGWVVNALKGYLVQTLTGIGSGQTRVIASNTANTITVTGTWTSPAAGTTFQIDDWPTLINTSINQSSLPGSIAAARAIGLLFSQAGETRQASTAGNIQIENLKVIPSAGSAALGVYGPQSDVFVNECNISGLGATNGVSMDSSFGKLKFNNSYVSSGLSSAIIAQDGTSLGPTGLTNGLLATNSYITSATTANNTGVLQLNAPFLGSGCLFESSGVTANNVPVIRANSGTTNFSITSSRITCPFNGSGGKGIEGLDTVSGSIAGIMGLNLSLIDGCDFGVDFDGPLRAFTTGTVTINGCANCVRLRHGAKFYNSSATTVTATADGGQVLEITLDGKTYTNAFVNGLGDAGTPSAVSNLAFGTYYGN